MSFLSTYHYLSSIISKRDSSADARCKTKQKKQVSVSNPRNEQTNPGLPFQVSTTTSQKIVNVISERKPALTNTSQ